MANRFPNKFAAKCSVCGNQVPAAVGWTEKGPAEGPKWITTCRPCADGVPAVQAPAARTYELTSEQAEAVELFKQGNSLAIQAGAGTGKTSTLVAIANSTDRQGQYVAFNKAIVVDAGAKLPKSCAAATAHSLAFRQVGKLYRRRLDSARQSSSEVARRLRLDPFFYGPADDQKVIQPKTLAGYVLGAITTFCNTADRAPSTQHIAYVDGLDPKTDDGKRTYENNDLLKEHLADAIDTAWADIVSPDGDLRFSHDNYLKIWELGIHGAPVIPGDYILFDEAQDASPVLLSVVEQQQCQVVFVGDAQQAIYEWRGAVDALSTVPADATCFLTNSFRFGPEIAEVANALLASIPSAELRLVGRGKDGTVGPVDSPDAILTRTNGGAVSVVLSQLDAGRTVHLVGGGGEVARFATAASQLQSGVPTDHPELAIFDSWAAVQDYVANDPQGSELKVLVKLIDDYGIEAILTAVGNTVSEADADVVVTTAHKSKGREWDSVSIHSDFPEADSDSERRLQYVAVTRAKVSLDFEACPAIRNSIYGEGTD